MHYGAYDMALDRDIPTIITRNGAEIGQRRGLSEVFLLIELNYHSHMDLYLNVISLYRLTSSS